MNQLDATISQVYYLTFYVAQHVSGASTLIIRSLQLQQQPLVLPLKRGGSSAVGRHLARPRSTALLPPRSNGKTRGCYCSCKLLMMGVKEPETCSAT